MLTRDADAAVAHFQLAAAIGVRQPGDGDAPAGGRVAHRVVDQIGHRAVQLGLQAGQLDTACRQVGQQQRVAVGRQAAAVGDHPLQQRAQRQPAVGRRARAAFQLGQGQQVVHQHLHAVCLLLHQLEHAGALDLGQRQAGHGLDEPGQHGQRGADLVRDIGDEITPHRLGPQALGDVLADQQFLAVAVAAHDDLQVALAARRREVDRIAGHAFLQVGHKRRHAHQVGDRLLQVALGVEPQVVGSDRAAPDNLVAGVEQQHAVGRGFDGRQKFAQAPLLGDQGLVARAQGPLDAVSQLAPQAGVARPVVLLRAPKPAQQARRVQHVLQYDAADPGHCTQQRADDDAAVAQPQQRRHQEPTRSAQ